MQVTLQAETITVAQLFAEFLQHKRSIKGSKNTTIHGDLGMFTRHIQPQLGDKALAELQNVQRTLTSKGKWCTAELTTILLKSLLSFAAKRYPTTLLPGVCT